MTTYQISRSIEHVSGEKLLLAAIFGKPQLRKLIDRELDRRARLHAALRPLVTGRRQAA